MNITGTMIKSHLRGHEIYYSPLDVWLYADDNEPADDSRACKKCGEYPDKNGHDACQGHIKGATSVCCGHGVSESILIKEPKRWKINNTENGV